MHAHPRIELDVAFDDRRTDIVGEGFDLAVRIGKLADSSLIARKLAPIRAVVVASPDYLARAGEPQRPRDLSQHDMLVYTNVALANEWHFERGGRHEIERGKCRSRTNSANAAAAAEAGLGIAACAFIAAPRASAVRFLRPCSWTGRYAKAALCSQNARRGRQRTCPRHYRL